MTRRTELLRILREQTERMRIDAENLFTDIDKLHEFVSLQYDLALKREAEREARMRREKSGAFYSPMMDGRRRKHERH